ncbi:MAG: hypothetical protein J3K34DRAFT_10000 [Monoraphidium minutum]|nr:MAG: hypothetical protein J3K34DRAFT_10000 [Monoraphidium minutum]
MRARAPAGAECPCLPQPPAHALDPGASPEPPTLDAAPLGLAPAFRPLKEAILQPARPSRRVRRAAAGGSASERRSHHPRPHARHAPGRACARPPAPPVPPGARRRARETGSPPLSATVVRPAEGTPLSARRRCPPKPGRGQVLCAPHIAFPAASHPLLAPPRRRPPAGRAPRALLPGGRMAYSRAPPRGAGVPPQGAPLAGRTRARPLGAARPPRRRPRPRPLCRACSCISTRKCTPPAARRLYELATRLLPPPLHLSPSQCCLCPLFSPDPLLWRRPASLLPLMWPAPPPSLHARGAGGLAAPAPALGPPQPPRMRARPAAPPLPQARFCAAAPPRRAPPRAPACARRVVHSKPGAGGRTAPRSLAARAGAHFCSGRPRRFASAGEVRDRNSG